MSLHVIQDGAAVMLKASNDEIFLHVVYKVGNPFVLKWNGYIIPIMSASIGRKCKFKEM